MKKFGSRRDDLYLCLLFLITLLTFLPVLNHFFIMNDADWILRAQQILHHPKLLFTLREDGYFRPFLFGFITALYPLFGRHFLYYRILPMAFHFLNVGLLYALYKHFSGRKTYAFLVALLFLLSPAHYEEQYWFATLPHIVASSAAMASLLFYLKPFKRQGAALAASFIFFLVALFTREYMVILPLLLVLLRRDWRLLFYLLPLFFVFYLYRAPTAFSFSHAIQVMAGMSSDLVLSSFGFFPAVITEFQLSAFVAFFLFCLSPLFKGRLQPQTKLWLALTLLSLSPFVFSPFVGPLGFFSHYRYLYFSSFFFSSFLVSLWEGARLSKAWVAIAMGFMLLNSFGVAYRAGKIFKGYSQLSFRITMRLQQIGAEHHSRKLVLVDPPRSPFLVWGHEELLERNLKVVSPGEWRVWFVRNTNEMRGLKGKGSLLFLEVKDGQITPLFHVVRSAR